jgi:hypothetical protein
VPLAQKGSGALVRPVELDQASWVVDPSQPLRLWNRTGR